MKDIIFDLDKIDSYALLIAAVGYVIVFSSLVILYYFFRVLPVLINLKIRQRLRKEGRECAEQEDLSVPGEVNAAISMALYLFLNEMHDEESRVITIKRVSKTYSPWSSKIYGLRRIPEKH
jgi:glutaconyl-CoA/methylmalonyl-CoA decarboxylase subunit delta